MNTDNKIAVNFSPLKQQEFNFSIFRKIKADSEKKDIFNFSVQQRQLPIDLSKPEQKQDYWIVFEKREDFVEFSCSQNTNIALTISFLNIELENKCKNAALVLENNFFISKKNTDNSPKINKIYFVNQIYNSGKQCIWFKAEYLEIKNEFGFYSDFQFIKNKESRNFHEIQKLSLSLNSKGYANTAFHTDRYEQLKKFATLYYKKIFYDTILDFSGQQEIENTFLENKIYQFKNNKEGGLASDLKKEYPFASITIPSKIYFVCEENEKPLVQKALNYIRSVLKNIYESEPDCVLHIVSSHNIDIMKELIQTIENENIDNKYLVFIPIQDEKVNYYYQCKYEFDKMNIPIQFASHKTLKNNNNYAYDGLILQIFAKLGGIPWKMKPTSEKCLILGLAQANPNRRLYKKSPVKRFFGYSVLMDTSGIYKSLEVFSNELEKTEYLNHLKSHIVNIINQYQNNYKKIVIHSPFKIKEEELDAIQNAITESNAKNIEFVVIRINIRNDYFGYNKQRNSLVPFESSLIKLSEKKYLIWLEGSKRNSDEQVSKRLSGPAYVEFHYPDKLSDTDKKAYLQDILNLSGANWRGFKAKSEPASTYYCYLVTQFIKNFRLIGYEKLDFKNFQPWFL
jgi:ribosomal protein S17